MDIAVYKIAVKLYFWVIDHNKLFGSDYNTRANQLSAC